MSSAHIFYVVSDIDVTGATAVKRVDSITLRQ